VEQLELYFHANCPVCGYKGGFVPYQICTDFTVSGERFSIVSCPSCQFKFTNPIPAPNRLADYYKSEEYISHSDTKKGVVAKVYHLVRGLALKQKERLLSQYVSRGTLLDFGCGTGTFLGYCKSRGWSPVGFEPDSGARERARSTGAEVSDTLSGVWSLCPEKSVQAITLWHVLEHVFDLSETLTLFRRILSDKGVLVVAVPNHTSYDARKYKSFWAAFDVPRHLYHFDRNTMERLMSSHGFGLVSCHPMKFDSYYVSLLSERYRSGKSKWLRPLLNGFLSNLLARRAEDYSSVIYIFRKK
jgi:hypothetical protein